MTTMDAIQRFASIAGIPSTCEADLGVKADAAEEAGFPLWAETLRNSVHEGPTHAQAMKLESLQSLFVEIATFESHIVEGPVNTWNLACKAFSFLLIPEGHYDD